MNKKQFRKKIEYEILNFRFYKALLYYSTILSTILIIGGFYTSSSGKEIISNFLFLPIVVFLWITFIKYREKNKIESSVSKNKVFNKVKRKQKTGETK